MYFLGLAVLDSEHMSSAMTLLGALGHGELTIRQIEHFLAAAEEGTITGAAKRLRFSPSAVSASITELERSLGAELCIRRRAQGLTLTSTGRLVVAHARRILQEVAELGYAVRGENNQLVGPLVIGCFVTLAANLLPRLLDEYQALQPHVDVDFVVGAQDEIRDDIRSGRVDAALMYDLGDLDELDHFRLYEARGYALFGKNHPFASRKTVTLEDLAPMPLVLYDQSPSTRYAMSMFQARGVTPNIRHRTHAFELTRSIVARSESAYAVLVQRPANKLSYEGLPILEKEIVPPPPAASVVFAWPKGAFLSPRAQALAELIRAHYPTSR